MSDVLPQVKDVLTAAGMRYRVLECSPELADTEAFCAEYGFSPSQSANTIIVVSKTDPKRYAACVVLAMSRLDVNKKVRELLGAKKVSFAPMDEALTLTTMEYGGVTAVGLPADVPIFVDAEVMQQPQIVLGGGNRSSKLLLAPDELLKLPNLQVVQGLARPKAPAA